MRNSFSKLFTVITLAGVLGGALPQTAAAYFNPLWFAESANPKGRAEMPAGIAANVDVQIPNCPDANGILKGTGKMTATEANVAQVSAVQRGLTTEVKITGHVDDAAELTHFDMSGATTENGVSRVTITVEESTIGADGGAADRQGRTMTSVSPQTDAATAGRLDEASKNAVKAIFEAAAEKFRAPATGGAAGLASRLS